MPPPPPPWICCQLGAREHYAVPRALHRAGALGALITDAWLPPGNPLGVLSRKLRERWDPELAGASVRSSTAHLLAFEASARVRHLRGWPLILQRNRWFQKRAVRALAAESCASDSLPVLFAYSYAALELLRFAKAKGWTTVLGQIDPGSITERFEPAWSAPSEYWRDAREEWAIADRIVCNSDWSRQCLIAEGVPPEKLAVIPLAYEPPPETVDFQRDYPAEFSAQRPLRVLFLGSGTRIKGFPELMEAAGLLTGKPVEFRVVGHLDIDCDPQWSGLANVRFIGPVPRGATGQHYRKADVFVFPSFCDGFGLTQLEAQAWRLPVIASRSCGEVVRHNHNGWLLPEVTAEAIASALMFCLEKPGALASAAAKSGVSERFSLPAVAEALRQIVST